MSSERLRAVGGVYPAAGCPGFGRVVVVLAAAILRVAANHEPAAPTASKADVGVPVTGTSYYLLLVPLTAPVTFIFVYFNWLSFQFFQNT